MTQTEPIISTMSLVYLKDGTRKHGIFRCEADGIVVEHKSPEGRLARRLLASGYDAGRPFCTRWSDGRESLTWPSLAVAGASDACETKTNDLYWRKYEPFPERLKR